MSKSVYAAADPTEIATYAEHHHIYDDIIEDTNVSIYDDIDHVRTYKHRKVRVRVKQEKREKRSPRDVAMFLGMLCLGILVVVLTGLVVHYKLAYEQSQINYSNLILNCDKLFLEYDNTTQKYDNTTQEYDKTTQEYDKTTQEYDKTTQEYDKTTQGYDKTTQEYDSHKTTQEYDKTTQGYDKTTQGYDKTTQGNDKTTQEYDNTTPAYDKTTQDYDNRTQEYDNRTQGDNQPKTNCDALTLEISLLNSGSNRLMTNYDALMTNYSALMSEKNQLQSELNQLKRQILDLPEKPSVSMNAPGGIVEGRTVTLNCSSDASPPVDTYTWYREGGGRSISTGPQLVKDNVSPADSGQYFCQVTNTHGSQRSSPHSLEVQYGPKNVLLAVSPPGDVVKGDSATLTCSSSGSNPPIQSYILIKDNTVVAKKKITLFTISNIQPSDSGTYYCQAENNITRVNSTEVSVDVHYPPETPSVSANPPGGIVEGRAVTLTCSSDANPPVDTYTWYRDGGSRSISTGPQLVKDNVSPADSGQYFCQVTNTHGSQRSSPLSLEVQYGPKNVLLAVSPPGDVVEGDSATLTCSSSGSNPPIYSYILIKDNTVVAKKKIFTISNIQPRDSGTYYCQAENNITRVNSTEVSVNVHYPPKNPWVSMNPPGVAVEGRRVTLTCRSDANPPVDTYTWYRDGGNRSISTGPQLVKDNVSLADSGQYVCQVANPHGSERSPPRSLLFNYNVSIGPAECCFTYRAARLPKAGVKTYHRTHLHCATDGVVFHMKNGAKICTDPAQEWVQAIITHVESNS